MSFFPSWIFVLKLLVSLMTLFGRTMPVGKMILICLTTFLRLMIRLCLTITVLHFSGAFLNNVVFYMLESQNVCRKF